MTSPIMPNYGQPSLAFSHGEGMYLYGEDGKKYLDFGAGIATASLGHAHPHLVEALREQAGKLWHCSNLYVIPGQVRLAQRLVDNSFADMAFFCNSGAEAVEAGLKLVRKYHDDNGAPDRYRVITCNDSFHGRTLATISAGGNENHKKGFGPLMDAFDRVPFGNLNELRNAITKETAAILVEPVQGEGGVHPGAIDYLRGLRAAADEFGILLFFDEVQTGIGRTGKLFAYEHAGIAPDVMSVAKGLGGGFPIGACLATEKAASVMTAGTHGSTFGGNPLACAAANAVLDIVLADGFLDKVAANGKLLMDKLSALAKAHPKVFTEVRGVGLLIGAKCAGKNSDVVARLQQDGLLVIPAADNVVRFIPPLTVEPAHIDEAIAITEAACKDLAG